MTYTARRSFTKYISELPWLKHGVFIPSPAEAAYQQICVGLEHLGFSIVARNDALMRLCGYRDDPNRECSCLHVVWVRRYGKQAYLSYGLQPRYWFFRFCRSVDHLKQLTHTGNILMSAIYADNHSNIEHGSLN